MMNHVVMLIITRLKQNLLILIKKYLVRKAHRFAFWRVLDGMKYFYFFQSGLYIIWIYEN